MNSREKSYIDDDTSAPHVQAAIVALVPENLWSEIGRGSHHALPEAFLTNDARKSEITQFHLKNRKKFKTFATR